MINIRDYQLRDFNLEKTFWEENPELLACVPIYRDFYNQDKSKNKVESSTIMYAIAFIYDYESRFRNIPEEDRIELVEKGLLDKPGFFTSYYKVIRPLIDQYNKLQEDSPMRFIRAIDDMINKRSEAINNMQYNLQTSDAIDKLLLNTNKLLEEREKIELNLRKQEKDIIKGGQQLSLLASGKLQTKITATNGREEEEIEIT